MFHDILLLLSSSSLQAALVETRLSSCYCTQAADNASASIPGDSESVPQDADQQVQVKLETGLAAMAENSVDSGDSSSHSSDSLETQEYRKMARQLHAEALRLEQGNATDMSESAPDLQTQNLEAIITEDDKPHHDATVDERSSSINDSREAANQFQNQQGAYLPAELQPLGETIATETPPSPNAVECHASAVLPVSRDTLLTAEGAVDSISSQTAPDQAAGSTLLHIRLTNEEIAVASTSNQLTSTLPGDESGLPLIPAMAGISSSDAHPAALTAGVQPLQQEDGPAVKRMRMTSIVTTVADGSTLRQK